MYEDYKPFISVYVEANLVALVKQIQLHPPFGGRSHIYLIRFNIIECLCEANPIAQLQLCEPNMVALMKQSRLHSYDYEANMIALMKQIQLHYNNNSKLNTSPIQMAT